MRKITTIRYYLGCCMTPRQHTISADEFVSIKPDAKLIGFIARVAVAAGLLVLAVNAYWGVWYRVGGPGLILIGIAVLLMLRRGWVRSSALVFCWSVLAMVMVSALTTRGLNNVSWVAGPIMVLVSGWLLGARAAITMSLGSVALIVAMYVLQMAGFEPNNFLPLEVVMAVLIVANVIAALIGIASANTFNRQMALIDNARLQLHAIFNSSDEMIWSVDAQGFALTSFNRPFAQCMAAARGVNVQIGMPIEAVFVEADRIALWQHLYTRAIADKQYQVTCQDIKPDCYVELGFNVIARNGEVWGISVFGKDVTAQKKAQLEIEYLAYHDALTGLANRRLGLDRLHQAMADTRADGVGLLFVDVDQFKHVNDKFGHAAGDSVLKQLAQRLRFVAGERATVCRQAGDEFMLVLPGITSDTLLTTACEKLMVSLRNPFDCNDRPVAIACCIGAALFPRDASRAESLIQKADTALTMAKQAGSGSFRLFQQHMLDRLLYKIMVRDDLVTALERQEFVLHYQPQIDLASGRVNGAEALIRWQSPEDGLVGPAEFIGVAEEYGLISQIGRWVLIEACQQAARWVQAGFTDLVVAVNLSAAQFESSQVVADVQDALAMSGLNPKCLELELTESILLEHDAYLIDAIQQWRAQGITLSIDDFGTGYSSMAYLKRLKVDKLKIDRAFVQNLESDSENRAIVQAMLQIAHGFNLETIAEGVETESVATALKDMGCNEGQGYLFAKPLTPTAFEAWLRERLVS
jgi:diguanylate cyclase (GGDEF)-like protein